MKSCTCAEMSLALLRLKSEVVAVMRMVDLYFSALCERKSLSGCAMRFYFVHNVDPFNFYPDYCFAIVILPKALPVK